MKLPWLVKLFCSGEGEAGFPSSVLTASRQGSRRLPVKGLDGFQSRGKSTVNRHVLITKWFVPRSYLCTMVGTAINCCELTE